MAKPENEAEGANERREMNIKLVMTLAKISTTWLAMKWREENETMAGAENRNMINVETLMAA